ncbi:MAG: Sir2 family NAD-dependent protein deacetylase [Myxococcota bacterium]
MNDELKALLDHATQRDGLIVALTGAGISAESGIPTFRGEEGYWTVGSQVYRPQDMATRAAFERMPDEVWQWYLYRRTVCRRAEPNPAHRALVALEQALGDRFRLITQNVDGLHLRAGNSLERTYQIHGNIDFMRCADDGATELFAIPEAIGEFERDTALSADRRALLSCPGCRSRARPHVLWFDESYDEPLFRFESSLRSAAEAALVVVIGTSASTTLPWHVVQLAAQAGAALIDINIADNPFAEIARDHDPGLALTGAAGQHLPAIVDHLIAAAS